MKNVFKKGDGGDILFDVGPSFLVQIIQFFLRHALLTIYFPETKNI